MYNCPIKPAIGQQGIATYVLYKTQTKQSLLHFPRQLTISIAQKKGQKLDMYKIGGVFPLSIFAFCTTATIEACLHLCDSAAAGLSPPFADPKAAGRVVDEMEAVSTDKRKRKRREYPEPGLR